MTMEDNGQRDLPKRRNREPWEKTDEGELPRAVQIGQPRIKVQCQEVSLVIPVHWNMMFALD